MSNLRIFVLAVTVLGANLTANMAMALTGDPPKGSPGVVYCKDDLSYLEHGGSVDCSPEAVQKRAQVSMALNQAYTQATEVLQEQRSLADQNKKQADVEQFETDLILIYRLVGNQSGRDFYSNLVCRLKALPPNQKCLSTGE